MWKNNVTSVLHVTEGYVNVEGESHVLVTWHIGWPTNSGGCSLLY